jgi:hypothetical protein
VFTAEAVATFLLVRLIISVATDPRVPPLASGRGSRPSHDVQKATGAVAASFADFARRTAVAWAVDQAR